MDTIDRRKNEKIVRSVAEYHAFLKKVGDTYMPGDEEGDAEFRAYVKEFHGYE